MFYWPIIILFTDINADSVYRVANSCVFNSIQSIMLKSRLQCALKCDAAACKAFRYDKNQSVCHLYSFHEIFQSNTVCPNVTIFINNRYNNLFEGDSTSVTFQLLNGINFGYGIGYPSVYKIVKRIQAIPIVNGISNLTIIATGAYMNSRTIFLPKREMVTDQGKDYSFLRMRFLSYLTNGKCIDYFMCYHRIEDYKSHTGSINHVFGISAHSSFDINHLMKYILMNEWNFIVAGTFWNDPISSNMTQLFNKYGIDFTKTYDKTDWMITGNICRNVTK